MAAKADIFFLSFFFESSGRGCFWAFWGFLSQFDSGWIAADAYASAARQLRCVAADAFGVRCYAREGAPTP
jgi:hypothetical protein